MERTEVVEALRGFIAAEILEGQDVGLDAQTRLLELGLLNSLSILMLIDFVRKRFDVEMPTRELKPSNLATPAAIADTVLRLAGEAEMAT